MTGYGRASLPLGAHTLTAQISAVNRKTLDLSVSLPRDWSELESEISEIVRKAVVRGKIHVAVELSGKSGASPELLWNTDAASETLASLEQFFTERGLAFEPTPDLAWQIFNAQRRDGYLPELEIARNTVLEAVEEALQAFVVMRAKEGEALLVDFISRMENLSRQVAAIAARAPQVAPAYRETLLRRLREAGLELDVEDERVLKEVALFADRCDISEELTRLKSHFAQFGTLLRSGGEMGRKAEFILQEIGREVHTIGSKANDLAISQGVIELKNELERVREQIANVE